MVGAREDGKVSRTASLVLLRHGSSTANERGSFGGWEDAALSELGVAQARSAGRQLQRAGVRFDLGLCSVLRRATWTLWHCLDALDQCWLPSTYDWRMNERHYGALQGMSKARAQALYGEEQVRHWRRSYRAQPPLLEPGDARDSYGAPAYAGLSRHQVPLGESLRDTQVRVNACWEETVRPALQRSQSVLVVAHGNSIRALLMSIEQLSEQDIASVEVPNGKPLLFESRNEGKLLVRKELDGGLPDKASGRDADLGRESSPFSRQGAQPLDQGR